MSAPESHKKSRAFRKFIKIFKVSPPLIWALFALFILNGTLLFISVSLDWKILHEIAVLGLTITPILFFYEGVLRRHLQDEMKLELRHVIDEAGIQNDILNIFKKTMPGSYKNLIDFGVSDAFLGLDAGHLVDRINNNKGSIKINKIWMPYLNESITVETIVNSVIAGNNYQIVLWDFEKEEPLARRVRALRRRYIFTLEDYKTNIQKNIVFFNMVWKELQKHNLQDKVVLRLHESFISGSLIGFEEYFLLGLYLHDNLATKGMQLKIDKDSPQGTPFFNQLTDHFENLWNDAHKEIRFSEEGYMIFQRD